MLPRFRKVNPVLADRARSPFLWLSMYLSRQQSNLQIFPNSGLIPSSTGADAAYRQVTRLPPIDDLRAPVGDLAKLGPGASAPGGPSSIDNVYTSVYTAYRGY